MNIKLISALAATGLLVAAPAFSAPVTIDFEGVSSQTWIDGYYNGGTDGAGNSGPNYGISFQLGAFGLQNDPEWGDLFANAPSGSTVMTAVDSEAALNVASGFAGQASFSYSSSENTSVSIYSGLNGTGSLLGTFELLANTSGCTEVALCYWDLVTFNFAGLAQSIQFGNTAGFAVFDDITITPVPLPAAGWLLLSALGGIGALARRKRAAA